MCPVYLRFQIPVSVPPLIRNCIVIHPLFARRTHRFTSTGIIESPVEEGGEFRYL